MDLAAGSNSQGWLSIVIMHANRERRGQTTKIQITQPLLPTGALNMSESENVRIHFLSNPENVRIGKRQNLKTSESELVRIGKCQNPSKPDVRI